MFRNKYFPFYAPCDFGYLMDYLSIFEVKVKKIGGEKSISNFLNCYSIVEEQIGTKILEVIKSDEYNYLVAMNARLFDLVDEVKKDTCKGKELDDQVYLRFLAKKAVNDKFFPDSKILEQKAGYEQKS